MRYILVVRVGSAAAVTKEVHIDLELREAVDEVQRLMDICGISRDEATCDYIDDIMASEAQGMLSWRWKALDD